MSGTLIHLPARARPEFESVRIRLTDSARRTAGLMQLGPINGGVYWVVIDRTRPLPKPRECPYCTKRSRDASGIQSVPPIMHEHKAFHLKLDEHLTVMVSPGIWGRLQMLVDCGGFEKVNVVTDPPPLTFTMPTAHLFARPIPKS